MHAKANRLRLNVTTHSSIRLNSLMLSLGLFLLLGVVRVEAKTLSLSETIDQALKSSPVLALEVEREKISDLEMQNRSNAFYPRLDLEATHGIGKTNVAQATEPWVSSGQLKLTENLYDNGVTWTKYQQGKDQREAARLSFQKARDQLIYDITEKYYAFSKASILFEAVDKQKEMVQNQFESISQKYHQGLRTKRDYLRFKAQSQKMQLDARAALNSKERLKLELKRLAGLPPQSAEYQEVDFTKVKPEEVQVVFNGTVPKLTETYEFKIAKKNADANKFDTDLAVRKYWPELSLTSGAYYKNESYLNSGRPFRDTEGYGWNILLQLQYNIWDWGERRREVEKVEAAQLMMDHEVRKTEQQLASELQQLMNDLKDAQLNLSVSEELLHAQTEAYDVIRRDYSEARAEYQDLMISLTDLLDAKTRYYGARYDLGTLIAKQNYFEGRLYGNIQK